MNNMIIYEQPLDEIIRVCLRLEQLFQQIDHQLSDLSILGTRNLITFIINALHLLDRPDLKAKLAKELSHHHATLRRFGDSPKIDEKKFKNLTEELDRYSRILIDSSGKMGQRLREVELLNTLRLHLASPGGGCSFDLPLYHYWLQQSADVRENTIKDWLNDFTQIRSIVTLVLSLVRENAKTEQKTAIHGFHQELLDPQWNLRLLRIGIAADLATYPEMSIGRHFLSIRYFTPDINKRPIQYSHDLLFQISYCQS